MRADMGKVLGERPRIKSFGYRPRPKGYKKAISRCLTHGDSPPVREGIKRPYGYHTKHFNEHLGPLRRFLDSNVGRPWNTVYSEICEHVDRDNVVQKHILTHLFQYVLRHVILIDGTLCNGEPGHRYGEPLDERGFASWYVCPKSGLLRRCQRVSRRLRKPRMMLPHLQLSEREWAVKWKGQWERITLAPLDAYRGADDVLIRQKVHCNHHPLGHILGNGVYVFARRPMTRAERLALPLPIEVVK